MRALALAVAFLLVPSLAAGQGLQVPDVDQGRLLAARIRYDVRAKVFTAEGNVRLVLGDLEIRSKRLRLEQGPQVAFASGNVRLQQRDTLLRADEAKYDIRSKVASVSGHAVMIRGDLSVRAAQIRFDLAAETMMASDGVQLVRGNSTLMGEALMANLRTKRAEVTGKAMLIRAPGPVPGAQDKALTALGQQETTITAARMTFRWDANEGQADGGVVVVQPDKKARAQRMAYSEAADRLELEGDVVVEQFSGNWLVQGGVVEAPKDQQTQKVLASKTIVTSDRLVIHLKDRTTRAEGKVTVTQGGRFASGDRALYTEKDRRIVVTGNVRLREEDGSVLRADRVIISMTDETFEAEGNVEIEFVMKRK